MRKGAPEAPRRTQSSVIRVFSAATRTRGNSGGSHFEHRISQLRKSGALCKTRKGPLWPLSKFNPSHVLQPTNHSLLLMVGRSRPQEPSFRGPMAVRVDSASRYFEHRIPQLRKFGALCRTRNEPCRPLTILCPVMSCSRPTVIYFQWSAATGPGKDTATHGRRLAGTQRGPLRAGTMLA